VRKNCEHVTANKVMELSEIVSSQIYQWLKGHVDRKPRERKKLSLKIVKQTVEVILRYPHLGGKKGSMYMLYHEIALIAEKAYQYIKVAVRWCLFNEMKHRKLLSTRQSYDHYQPSGVGEVWSADFTIIVVEGVTFYASVVRENYSLFYLGHAVTLGAGSAQLVSKPVRQALTLMDGKGPEKFLVTDRGSQYLCEGFEELLRELDVPHKLIPPGEPWYNGVAENGMNTIKLHFYRRWYGHWMDKVHEVWRKSSPTERNKLLLALVRACFFEVIQEINTCVPCPSLGGVTPEDVLRGRAFTKTAETKTYIEKEKIRMKGKEQQEDDMVDPKGVPKAVGKFINASEIHEVELRVLSMLFGGKPLRMIKHMLPSGVG
jgi:transposase InsO family protein